MNLSIMDLRKCIRSEHSALVIVMPGIKQQSKDSQTQTNEMQHVGLGFAASNISLELGDCNHWRGGVGQSGCDVVA